MNFNKIIIEKIKIKVVVDLIKTDLATTHLFILCKQYSCDINQILQYDNELMIYMIKNCYLKMNINYLN
jgi:hypothetical protein